MRRFFFLSLVVFVPLLACKTLHTTGNKINAPRPGPGIFFVATTGDDNWPGTSATPSMTRKKGPFKTVQRALEAALELKQFQGGAWKQPVSIYIRGGNYWLPQPLVFTPALSATSDFPLLIAAYPGEQPVLSAGQPITNWNSIAVDGKKLWSASVPWIKNGAPFHQLWVKGERRQRARHPNTGYFKVAGLPESKGSWEQGGKRFVFTGDDLKNWKSSTNGEAIVMDRWVESRLPITNIDEKNKILASSKRTVFQLQAGDPYYVEGVFEALDQPGEWFLDQVRGLIFYQPFPEENIKGFSAVAPRLQECLRIEGNPAVGEFVENIFFQSLTFSHNEWFFPANFGNKERHISSTPEPDIFGFSQAAFGVPGAVQAEGARGCEFRDCQFSNLGSYGLQLGRGCQSNSIARCKIFDLGAGGIRLGETILRTNQLEQAHHNSVIDSEIHDGGKMFPSGEGIWIGQSFDNHIAHNAIYNFFYTGISIGWTWGYETSLATNNIVEFNEVHHIGQKTNGDGPILDDMGGIYTLGPQRGTIIRNNLWHDISALRYGGWGIYFDEGSTEIVAENNVVFNTTHGGFHQHYGKENLVRNNVFALARDWQLQRSRSENHVSFTFQNNIVYFNRGKLLEGDWAGGKINQDSNLFFDARAETNASLNFPGGLEKWRANNHDVHSVIADPQLATTNFRSFALKTNSPAWQLGFQPIDMKSVGPRKLVVTR
ncbi:MAG: right-handed parallel beta-helix repeat-containing protein [Verrucomicrobiota bacterium]